MGQTKLNDTQITPAGNDTQIQFNDGDVFNGDALLTWDKTNKMLELGGANWYSGGGSAPDGIHVTKEGGGVFTTVLLGHSYVDGTDGITGTPAVGGDRAGGTKASPTAVVDGMGLSRFIGAGYDGTAISGTRAQILLRAAGNWSGSSHPTKIELYTTPSGSTTRAIALTIGSDGNVNIESGKTYNIAGSPHTHNVLIPFGVFRGISPISANTYMNLFAIDKTYSFVKWTQNYFVETTNDATNYWNIEIRRLSDAAVINAMTTISASINTWYRTEDSTFSISSAGTSATGLTLYCYKTGSPGALYVSAPTLEATPS